MAHEKNARSTNGSCIISEEVVASIACNAALEVPGVGAMASLPWNWHTPVRTGVTRSVSVTGTADQTVIDIAFSPLMSARIATVAQQVQEAVKTAVQAMTGSPVTKVNVHVSRPVEAAQVPGGKAE